MAPATIAASATVHITASEIHPFRILIIPYVIVPGPFECKVFLKISSLKFRLASLST